MAVMIFYVCLGQLLYSCGFVFGYQNAGLIQVRGNRSYNAEVGGNQNLADVSHVNDIISIFITIEKKLICIKQSLLDEIEFQSGFSFYKALYSFKLVTFIFRHLDGNYKLIRWGLVIHGGIDGFSRLVAFFKCSTNSKAKTVLDSFYQVIQQYRAPLKIRTDHGTKNIAVARYMLEKHGLEGNPVIAGKSVHNHEWNVCG